MSRDAQRYGDVAVLFHWLIAMLIIGLLAIGKYMVSLDDTDPVRFALTQWHKSFGLTVLLLSALRLLWRFIHSPPPEPESIARWQQRAAAIAHFALYALMFILPVTGWIMVSASPLDIDTVLFKVIPVPHLPPFADLPGKAAIAENFHDYHEIASGILIVILLAHIGAAFKHHFIDQDEVMIRMLPTWSSVAFRTKFMALAALIGGISLAIALFSQSNRQAALLAAGDSDVSFIADVAGTGTPGVFTQTEVNAAIDQTNPENSSLSAIVQTASVQSDNTQVEGSLPSTEWLNSAAFPEATFKAGSFSKGEESALLVDGELTIKDITRPVSFELIIEQEDSKLIARGEFDIDRREFNAGMQSQSSEDNVGFMVTIRFRFDISDTPPAQ